MLLSHWLVKLRKKLKLKNRPERRLRLVTLEERCVPDASFALTGVGLDVLMLGDGGASDSISGLTISEGTFDFGGGDLSIDFQLASGSSWLGGPIAGTAVVDLTDTNVLHVAQSVIGVLVNQFDINGNAAENDVVTVDLTDANGTNPVLDIDYDGGVGGTDSLIVNGYSVQNVDVLHTGADSGQIEIGTVVDGDQAASITFSGLEPLTLGGTAVDLVITLPGSIDATLSDDVGALPLLSAIDATDGVSFEYTEFVNPTGSLTINDGTGAITILVEGLDAAFDADLSILDDDATDDNTVTFQTNETDIGTGSLTVDADTVNINADITTAGGDVDINAVSSVAGTVGDDITTTAAADSGIASGAVTIDAGTTISLAGDIITTGAGNSIGAGSDAGSIDLVTLDGSIVLAGINAAGGTGTGGAGGAGATVNITAGDAGADETHDVTLGGAIITSGGTGTTEGAGGDVNVIADHSLAVNASITAGGGSISLDANSITGDVAITAPISTSGAGTVTIVADDSVTFTAAGDITATDAGAVSITANVDAVAGDSGDVITMADGALIDGGSGTITLTTAGASGGDVTLGGLLTTNTSATAISVISNADVLDGGDANVDASAADGQVNLSAVGDIGSGGTDIFKDVFDAIEVTATDLVAAAGALSAISPTVSGTMTLTAVTQVLQSAGALDVSGVSFATVTGDLSLLAGGTLTIADTGISVTTNLRLDADDVDAMSGGTVILGADSLLMNLSTTSSDELISVTLTGLQRLDVETAGDVQVRLNSAALISDLDCDLAGIDTAGNTAVLDAQGGDVTQDVALVGLFDSRIVSDSLLLLGTSNFHLCDAQNDIDTLAASTTGNLAYTDIDDLMIGDVTQVTPVTTVSGITTGGNDVLLNVGGALTINEIINAGVADNVRLTADGNITQAVDGIITADRLGVRQESTVSGDILLGAENVVATIAMDNAFTGGVGVFRNSMNLTIGSVAAQTLGTCTFTATTGIQTNDGDVLIDSGGTLTIDEAVNTRDLADTADVRLISNGDMTQAVAGIITTDALGVRQQAATGSITLDDANDANLFAADNTATAGTVVFHDTDAFAVDVVGTQTLATRMFAATTGIQTDDGDVILDAGGTLDIDAAINTRDAADTADVRLIADGSIAQAVAGTIATDELGVRQENMVAGSIVLDDANDVNTFAVFNAFGAGLITFVNIRTLTIGTVATQTIGSCTFAATDGVVSSGGAIRVDVNGQNNDLNVTRRVLSSGGSITLEADDSISFTADGDVTGGSVVVTANADFLTGDTGNAIIMADDTLISSGGGTISLSTTGANGGDITLGGLLSANDTGAAISVDSGGNVVDGGDTFVDASASAGTVTITAVGSIGSASGDVFKVIDPIEVTASDLIATAGVLIAIDPTVSGTITLTAPGLVLTSAGDLDVSTVAFGAFTDVALLSGGIVTIAAGGLTVAGDLRIDAVDVDAFGGGNVILGAERLLVDVTTATDDIIEVTLTGLQHLDVLTASDVRVMLNSAAVITDLNCDLTGLNTTGNTAVLDGQGFDVTQNVAQTGLFDSRILSTNLLLLGTLGTNNFILCDEQNDITTLAARTTGNVAFTDINDLTVGTVAQPLPSPISDSGITTLGSDVLLNAGGTLSITEAVDAGVGDVRLIADGSITQTATGVITANELGVRQEGTAIGDVILDDGNDVDVLAVDNTATDGVVVFNDINGLIIGEVAAQTLGTCTFTITTGIQTDDGDVLINVDGTLTINNTINTRDAANTADVRLVSDGDITQLVTGVITTDSLGVRQESAVGDVILDAANDATLLAVDNTATGGTLVFHDINDLMIGSVTAQTIGLLTFTATAGIQTDDGDVLIDAGGTLTIDEAINTRDVADTADIRLIADGDITQSATGIITTDSLGIRQEAAVGGDVILDAANDVNLLAVDNTGAGGRVAFRDTDELIVGAVIAQTIGSCTFTATTGIQTDDGDVLIDVDGTLTINETINTRDAVDTADVRLVADGDVTQSTTGVITTDSLGVRQESTAGDVLLDDGNDVNLLAVDNTATAGVVVFRDTDELIIGDVATQTIGLMTFATTTGLQTDDGDILIDVDGSLTINEAINTRDALDTADVRFVVDGDITQSAAGIITTDQLGVRQESAIAGDIVLDAANDVNLVTVDNNATSGVIVFHDIDDLLLDEMTAQTIGLVTFATTTGIQSDDGDVLINVDGTLDIGEAINTRDVVDTADVRLIADGDITQSPTGIITTDALGVRQESATGDVVLDDANDVNLLAVDNTATGGRVVFNDINGLIIGEVVSQTLGTCTFTTTTGIQTDDGDVLINVDGLLTINETINTRDAADTADVRLVADGSITQSTTGTVVTDSLGVRQEAAAGDVILDAANDVNLLAVDNTATGGVVAFRNTDDLVIGDVATQTIGLVTFATTTGLQTDDGDVLIDVDGTLTINEAVNTRDAVDTADVRLVADGDITQSITGVITTDSLGVRQESPAGDVILDDANDVNLLAVDNTGTTGVVVFHDTDDLVIGAVATGTIGLLTFTTSTGIQTDDGDVLINADGPLTINEAINTRDASDTADVRLSADGSITQSATGVITTDSLGVRQEAAAGDVILDDANDVNLLAVDNTAAGGVVVFRDIDELIIGAVAAQTIGGCTFTATAGIQTDDGDVLIDVDGTLTINEAVNTRDAADTADVRLVADGDITQSTTGVITTDSLGVRQEATAGDVILDAANDVNVLAVDNTGTSGVAVFHDTDDLTIGEVATQTIGLVTFATTTGIQTDDGDVLIDAGGPLTINEAINTRDLADTADVRLIADGSITQSTTGVITTDSLGVRQEAATGDVILDDANDVNLLSVDNTATDGVVVFRDIDELIIGAVAVQTIGGCTFTATAGIQTDDGDVLIDVDGSLTINEAVNTRDAADTADVRLVADGDITQSTTGVITTDSVGVRQQAAIGDVILDDANDVNLLAVDNTGTGGVVVFHDTDDLIVGEVATQTIGLVTFATTTGVQSDDGDILINVNGSLTINEAINTRDVLDTADVRLVADGDITQGIAGTITTDLLGVRQEAAAGDVIMDAANDVNLLAVDNTAAGGVVAFRDVDELIIGAVTAQTIGACTFTATAGIQTDDGDVLIDVDGTLTINEAINTRDAADTADVRLVADGDITQIATGVITTDSLGVRQQAGVGDVILDDANDINLLAVDNAGTGGVVVFHDTDDLIVGEVATQTIGVLTFTTTTGIQSDDGDILINADGPLTINEAINTRDVADTADVRLAADGSITQGVAGAITTDSLGVRQEAAAGDVIMDAANDVNLLAIDNTAASGVVAFRDIDELIIGAVTAQTIGGCTFTATAGIQSDDGDVLIDAGDALSINEAVNTRDAADTADVRLVAGGNVSQNAIGVITTDSLGVRQEGAVGSVILDDANDVNLLAVDNSGTAGVVVFRDTDELIIGDVAAQTIGAITFATATGIQTDDGDVLINVDGTLTINETINTRDAFDTGDVRLVADGAITQSATGTIVTDALGIRQDSVTAGDVMLTADNDVSLLAVNNAATDADATTGIVSFNDINDLTIGAVAAQTIGLRTFAATSGIQTVGSNISVTVGGSMTVDANIDATTTSTTASAEVIFLTADENFTLTAGNKITTDEDEATVGTYTIPTGAHAAQPDRITILADADADGSAVPTTVGDTSTGIVTIETGAEVRTDEGLANRFTLRPAPGVNEAFYNFDSISTNNLMQVSVGQYLGQLTIDIGNPFEENLILNIAWGDLPDPAGAFATTFTQAGTVITFSQAVLGSLTEAQSTAFLLPTGDRTYIFEHIFTQEDIVFSTVEGRNPPSDPFQVRFTVQHHVSILITGNAVSDGVGAPEPVPPGNDGTNDTTGLVTSTDITEQPPVRFDDGEAEFLIPTTLPARLLAVEEEPEVPQPEPVIPPEPPPLSILPVFPDIGSETGSSVAVEDPYFELRRTFEDGTVETLFRFPDEVNTPKQLEEYIREYQPKEDQSPLTDGSGYEVWSISKQVKRRVVEFEITAGQLRTAVEQLPETFENLELDIIEMPGADAIETDKPADDSMGSFTAGGIDGVRLDAPELAVPDAGYDPEIRHYDVSPEHSATDAAVIIDTTIQTTSDDQSESDSNATSAIGLGLGFGHLARRLRSQRRRTNRFSHAERMRNRLRN